VDPLPDSNDLRITYVTENGQVVLEDFDMVVLSVGLETPKESLDLFQKLGIGVNANQFVEKSSFTPVETSAPGIYACGVVQGPKDIPQSVMEASAAACAAARNLAAVRNPDQGETDPQAPDRGRTPRIGVFVCDCGINIAGVVRVPEVTAYARRCLMWNMWKKTCLPVPRIPRIR
jgi:heterodisulfide reductase subunit A